MAKNKDMNPGQGDANRDPLSGAPGAHPIGVGTGAASAGAVGTAIGAVVGGPIGAIVGAAIGSVVGGLSGKAAAEVVNPTMEDTYWRDNYRNRTYARPEHGYDTYRPAYKYGWESRMMHGNKNWTEVESDLGREWTARRGSSKLEWNDAKNATRDAWDRIGASQGHEER